MIALPVPTAGVHGEGGWEWKASLCQDLCGPLQGEGQGAGDPLRLRMSGRSDVPRALKEKGRLERHPED